VSTADPGIADFGTTAVLDAPPRALAQSLTTLEPERNTAEDRGFWARFGQTILIYVLSRLVLMGAALFSDAVFPYVQNGKNNLSLELANWDGFWYVHIATLGYPTVVIHGQTNLGFLPLFPATIWLVAHIFSISYVIAGYSIAVVGGLVATLIVQQLATDWWGPVIARKAATAFILFPGTIVFSMVYSEGLLIPIIAGLILALSRKRWVLAGILAGAATAIGPDALSLIPMCAGAALLELRRAGWRDHEARRSLWAPVLSPVGVGLAAVFFWIWAGSPLADYTAQATGWKEKTSLFAIPHQLAEVINGMGFRFSFWHVNLNIWVGLFGVVFLLVGLKYLWRDRALVSLPVLFFCWAMAFLTLTSWGVPPNPRMLITAFPVVIVYARVLRGRAWTAYLVASSILFVVLSTLTYTGSLLRP
jgi:hypothetical protein